MLKFLHFLVIFWEHSGCFRSHWRLSGCVWGTELFCTNEGLPTLLSPFLSPCSVLEHLVAKKVNFQTDFYQNKSQFLIVVGEFPEYVHKGAPLQYLTFLTHLQTFKFEEIFCLLPIFVIQLLLRNFEIVVSTSYSSPVNHQLADPRSFWERGLLGGFMDYSSLGLFQSIQSGVRQRGERGLCCGLKK